MPVAYRYDAETNLVDIDCFGRLTIVEIRRYFEDLEADESMGTGVVEIVDLTRVEDFSLDSSQARLMPDAYRAANEKHDIRATLLVCPSEVLYGMGRMIQAYFHVHLSGHVFELFRSREAALERAADFV